MVNNNISCICKNPRPFHCFAFLKETVAYCLVPELCWGKNMVVCSPARTAPLQAAVWKGLVEFAPVKQGHPEGNCGYLTIMLVVVTENPLILLTS